MGASGGWFVGGATSTSLSRAGRVNGALRRFTRAGGFRTVQLNVVGWASLLGPGAMLGLMIARLVGGPVLAGGALGAAVAWAIGLVVDTVRWRASDICFGGLDVPRAELDRLVEDLRAGGVEAAIEVDVHDTGADKTVFQIRSRMRFRGSVERRLAELTIP